MKTQKFEIWFACGSQPLYGAETIRQVEEHAKQIVSELGARLSVSLVYKGVLSSPDAITRFCEDASSNKICAGVITWMHTFSPSKMWIGGLTRLTKPLLHLHTQFNRDIPWAKIDMDFMNLNQSAHGDREHGFIGARLRLRRKVVVGYYKEDQVVSRIDAWMRAASAFADGQNLKVLRFGDNMREVAVTEGDKVEAQIQFGWSVNGYGLGPLSAGVNSVSKTDLDKLINQYKQEYELASDALSPAGLEAMQEQGRIELALRSLLEENDAQAFTTTFQDLHGLKQLPGLAVQRLMADGYGFGAEGDWKTAALVRAMKVMAQGLPGGVSFMEDYTYHFEPGNSMVLGAHMLEVCPSIAKGKPRIEVHPLAIGGKSDPARLVFDATTGPALNASLIDLGKHYRLLINPVESVAIPEPMPKLPVARVLWKPEPELRIAAEAWILAGGAHHTGYTTALRSEHLEDYAEIAGIETVMIDKDLNMPALRRSVRG